MILNVNVSEVLSDERRIGKRQNFCLLRLNKPSSFIKKKFICFNLYYTEYLE